MNAMTMREIAYCYDDDKIIDKYYEYSKKGLEIR